MVVPPSDGPVRPETCRVSGLCNVIVNTIVWICWFKLL